MGRRFGAVIALSSSLSLAFIALLGAQARAADPAVLTLAIPTNLAEGNTGRGGNVSIPTASTSDLVVSLSTSDAGAATVPPSVTIPAGQTTGYFTITVTDDALKDGPQPVVFTAAAQGFSDAAVSTEVADNELHALEMAFIPSPQIRNAPIPVTLTARDISGAIILNYDGSVALSAASEAGPSTCSPSSAAPFINGVSSSAVAIPVYGTNVRLTAGNAEASCTSNAFAQARGPFTRFGWANIPSAQAVDFPIDANIRAEDAGGNLIEEFTGDVSLKALSPGPRAPTGTGTFGSTTGFSASFSRPQVRMQCIYTPAEVGGAGRLAAVEFSISSVFSAPAPLNNYTVRLKHTQLENFNSQPARWETADWVVVYRGSMRFTTTGWVKLPFSQSFEYDGTRNLMVDVSFTGDTSNFSSSSSATTLCTPKSDYRKLSTSSSLSSDPLTWSGFSPLGAASVNLPNLRFHSYELRSQVRPATTASFSGGVWSGHVSVPFVANGVALEASDGNGHRGGSNDFEVRRAILAPGTGTIYAETFDSAPLTSAWAFTGTGAFRTQVTNINGSHGGLYSLSMDSYSLAYSRNEATWTVDLAGMSGLVLQFWARKATFEGEHGPPPIPFTNGADFDGVAISTDGTTWYEVQGLRAMSPIWTQVTVDLDKAISSFGLSYNSAFKIRFNQYDTNGTPPHGISIDDIQIISPRLASAIGVTGPAQVSEVSPPVTFGVLLPAAVSTNTVLTLRNSSPDKVTVPEQITILAGRTDGYFQVQPIRDGLVDGAKPVTIWATSDLFPAGNLTFTVTDADQPMMSFTVPTTSTVEGAAAIQAEVRISAPAAAPIVFNVTSSNTNAIRVPNTISIPLGATSILLPLTVFNDSKIDGEESATVTVTDAVGGAAQSHTITVADNETLNLRLESVYYPPPTSVNEGPGTLEFYAYLPGIVTTPTTLSFSSSSPTRISPPSAVTIAAGSTSAPATFTMLEDQLAEASGPVTLTVSAPGFNPGTYVLTYQDNDPHHYTVSPIASPQVRGGPIPVTVAACDPTGATLSAFSGEVSLSGSGVSVEPSLLSSFQAGLWSGSLRVNDSSNAVVLTVSDGQGHTGASNAFAVGVSSFDRFTFAPVPAAQTPGRAIPIMVTATDSGGNVEASVNEPFTLRALTPTSTVMIGGNSSLTTPYFLYTYYGRARSQVLYLASELGGQRSIGGIAYQVTSGSSGQVLSNFTIRLKTTSQTALDYATGWDSTGWTVVHRSNQVLSSTGWVTFLFDTPFEYDGVGNLLIDLSFNNPSPTSVNTYWAADSVSTNRMLYGYSSIVADPLLWAGTANLSSNSNQFPKTRFLTLEPVAMGVSGATAVASGAWNGTASVPGYVDRVYLEAFDEAGRQGRSNPFTVAAPAAAGPPIPFNDGFESGSFSKAWSVSGTAAGRARVLSTNLPHTGAQHAVLDTASGNARAELTLTLDLTGHSGVSLSFWAKRFGGSDDGPPAAPFTTGADFDGVAMSADGAKWYEIQPLRAMTSGAWTQFTVNLDAAVAARALAYTAAFRIRFNQYGYDYAPYDGIAIDDVSVTGVPTARLRVTLPSAVREGDAPIAGSVILPAAASSDTLVALSSSSPFVMEVPSNVTVPAGQTTASFTATQLNNALLTGPIDVEITASAPEQIGGNASIRILDEEAATLALAIPSPVGEAGGSVGATLSISPPAATTVNVALTSSLPELVNAPATVQIPPGAGNVTIPLTLLNNSRLNGSQSVTLTASVPGWTSVTRDFTVTDDETSTLTLVATSLIEGGSSTLSLYAGGTLPSDVVVTLTSSDPSRLSVPATVTIPSGASFVGIGVTALNNTATDGIQSITVTASAPGMASGSAKVTVFDNDVHHFTFAGIGPAQVRGVPLPITLTARDVNERVITSFVGQVSLSASGDAGAIPCTPAMVSFTSGTWSGGVTMGSFSQNVRLTASDAAGHSGTSVPFDIGRGAPAHYAWSPIVSPGVAGQSFPATITALDGGDNVVSGYSGYVKLSPVLPERNIGSGTSSTGGFPCNTSLAVERTQVIYAAGELGGAGAISALSLYFASTPSLALSNWTIRIKPTPLSSFSSASPWEDNDWTNVHSSTAVVTQTGWVTFPFTAPFAYDGVNNLMVDFSFSNTTSSYAASVRTFLASSPRTLYYASGSGNGDPRTWSGTTVPRSTSSTVPQVKLTMATPGMTVSPSVVLLSSGNWTGDLRVNAPATGLAIQAVDFSGRAGLSNAFSVQGAADADGDGLPDAWELANGLDSANGTGDHGALGDPDGDGIPNIVEYALNLNPHGFTSNALPSSGIVTNPADGKEYLEFAYRRRIGVPGIAYVVETSGDAAVWTGDVSAYQLVSGPLALGDGVTETVVVRVLPAVRTPGSPSRHARLRISAP